MRARIWEDPAAMGVVSVLGFLMNDEGEVVGPERTQVLCKLMPSIHTLTHRAILAMLIAGLSDADAQTFYAEKGLKVLNAWLQDGLSRKKEPGMSKEKRRVEMFSQVRALLRIMDVSVQTDAARKQNSFIAPTLPKAIDLLDNAGPDYSAEWSRLNIYRRHFESSCGTVSTFRESRNEPVAKRPRSQAPPASTATTTSTSNGASNSITRPGSAGSLQRTSSFTSTTTPTSTTTTTSTSVRTTSSRPASASAAASVLQYQPKSFLQQDSNASKQDDEMDEYVEEDDEDMLTGAGFITNVGQPTINASLDKKIRANGHSMQYIERTPCRVCKRMGSKRCEHCDVCLKCAQRDKCLSLLAPRSGTTPNATTGTPSGATSSTTTTSATPSGTSTAPASRPGGVMTAEERTKQVLGSAMDKAIYNAFRYEDFHSAFSLISNGMDVNFQRVESDNSTVLMAAAHHGRDDAVKKLLQLGANPCLAAKDGKVAWMFAELRGHMSLMEDLKKRTEEWEATHGTNSEKSAS